MIRLFLRMGGWAALPFLCLSLLVGIVWFLLSENARALNAGGVMVEAQVLSLRIDEPRRPGPGKRTTSYAAIVGFTLDGTRHQARQAVSQAFFETLSPRQTITIRVLPADPGILEIEPGAAGGNAAAAFWIALALWLTAALAATLSWRLARRIHRLRHRGVPRTAEVTDIRPFGDRHILHFRWRDRNGTPRLGHTRPRRLADGLAGLAPGDPLTVAEDPDNPARAMWPGDLWGVDSPPDPLPIRRSLR